MAGKKKTKATSSHASSESVMFQPHVPNEHVLFINKLCNRKRALQSKLDNFAAFVDQIKLHQDNSKIFELELRIQTVENCLLSEFSEVQLEIETADPDNFDPSETSTFESFYFTKVAEAKHLLKNYNQPPTNEVLYTLGQSNQLATERHSGAKLPVIELPKFNGAADRWLEFKDLFLSLVHRCSHIEPINKFHYLRSSLDGAAARCISCIDFCSDNYEIAWDTLCSRFENKNVMVHNYIKALFDVKLNNVNSHLAFRDLIDNLTKNLKCLKKLGIETNTWDHIIIYLVTSKMDSSIVREWEKQDFSSDLPTLEDLKALLTNQADVLEKINMHQTQKTRFVPPEHFKKANNYKS